MANLLQSSQTQATVAPSYYTDYLSNLASQGQQAAQQAQYVGAQPLQEQAFQTAAENAGAFQPGVAAAQNLATQAAKTNIAGAMTPYANAALQTSGTQVAQPYVNAGIGTSGLAAAQPYLTGASQSGGLSAALPYLSSGTSMSTIGAADPYLQAAAMSGGLGAASPYLQQATQSPANLAAQYMNPFVSSTVQNLSDIAQRNIRENLAPQAVSATVGSGQFGSQRGAQVLGQINRQAQQDLNSQISQLLASGYGQALTAAGQQNALMGTLGQTAGTLGQQQANLLGTLGSTAGSLTGQQMQNLLTAGTTAGTLGQQQANLLGTLGSTAGTLTNQQAQNLINAGQQMGSLQQAQNQIASGLGTTATQAAANQASALNQAAQQMGTLSQTGQNLSLADINALATLGGQQQTIAQNQQLFPLTNLSTLSAMLRGYNIPTATTTTAQMSPLSILGGTATGLAGFFSPTYDSSGNIVKDASGNPITQASNLMTGLGNVFKGASSLANLPINLGGGISIGYDSSGNPIITGGTDSGPSPSNDQILEDLGLTREDLGWT